MKAMRASHFALISLLFAGFVSALPVCAEDEMLTSEEKAEQSHKLAMTDMIYEPENLKALYYQNEAIIQILKEIREEMHAVNVRDAKDTK